MFTKFKIIVLSVLFFLFPLFFLPLTQEFFAINKFLLVFICVILLMGTLLLQLIVERKITIKYSRLDASVLFLVLAAAASLLISSPNKVSAFFNFPIGLLSLTTFAVTYLIIRSISKDDWKEFSPLELMGMGSIAAAFISLIFLTNPFSTSPLPDTFAFLKTPLFNTVGSTLDLLLFCGFFALVGLGEVVKPHKKNIPILVAGGIVTVVIVINLYHVFKGNQLQLPPVSQSWLAAVETLKRPQTAIVGVGIDNFAGQFTLVKNAAYNSTDLWNANFALSRSAVLHLWTEMGLLGLVSFISLVIGAAYLLRDLREKKDPQLPIFILAGLYLLFALFLFPPSLPVLFLLFVYLGLLASQAESTKLTVDLQKKILLYVVAIFTLSVLLPTASYAVFRMYAAEFHFKQALNALSTGEIVPIYRNLQSAILVNPYEEKYRLTFSQLNLLVANNIAVQKKDTLTNQDRQNITQAIQDSIREAKAAVALNPDSSANWANLAAIYQNLLNVAEGADAWAVSAYQKAILQDPVNPQLRLSLGGVYYALKQFPNAATFFSQAVTLKPDWPNARYNLAWAFFQNKEYDKAILVMENVLTLIEKNSEDYKKAQSDLKIFKEGQAARAAAPEATPAVDTSPEKALTSSPSAGLEVQPTPNAVVSPKIELPNEASPSAQ